MLIQKLDSGEHEKIAGKVVEIIANGGIVCLPFDTVYGLVCDPKNQTAIEKIYRLKERDTAKSIGLAVDSITSLQRIAEIRFDDFISERTPGLFTFILVAKEKHFSKHCYKDGTIGVRIPDSKLILEICQKRKGAIAQTSANKSGQPNVSSIEDLKSQFTKEELSQIDLILDGGAIRSQGPSEIYDLTGDEPRKIERN